MISKINEILGYHNCDETISYKNMLHNEEPRLWPLVYGSTDCIEKSQVSRKCCRFYHGILLSVLAADYGSFFSASLTPVMWWKNGILFGSWLFPCVLCRESARGFCWFHHNLLHDIKPSVTFFQLFWCFTRSSDHRNRLVWSLPWSQITTLFWAIVVATRWKWSFTHTFYWASLRRKVITVSCASK